MVARSGDATRVTTPPPLPPAATPEPGAFRDQIQRARHGDDGGGSGLAMANVSRPPDTGATTGTTTTAATSAGAASTVKVTNPFNDGLLPGAALSQFNFDRFGDGPPEHRTGTIPSNAWRSDDPPGPPAATTTGSTGPGFATAALSDFPGGVPPNLINPKLTDKVHDLSNDAYAVTYSGVSRTPLVSSEHLTKASVEAAGKIPRKDDFKADTRLPADERSELSDYQGFVNVDRGHMAPNGDMPTTTDASQSFLLSNMVPQAADQNEGVWEQIESGVRNATGAGDANDPGHDIYVASGPAFIGNSLQSLNGRVLIPTATWKAVYIPSENQMGVYWVPNENTVTPADVETISVNELQQRIGIDVFPAVTDPALRDQADVPVLAKADFTGRVDPTSPDANDLTKHS